MKRAKIEEQPLESPMGLFGQLPLNLIGIIQEISMNPMFLLSSKSIYEAMKNWQSINSGINMAPYIESIPFFINLVDGIFSSYIKVFKVCMKWILNNLIDCLGNYIDNIFSRLVKKCKKYLNVPFWKDVQNKFKKLLENTSDEEKNEISNTIFLSIKSGLNISPQDIISKELGVLWKLDSYDFSIWNGIYKFYFNHPDNFDETYKYLLDLQTKEKPRDTYESSYSENFYKSHIDWSLLFLKNIPDIINNKNGKYYIDIYFYTPFTFSKHRVYINMINLYLFDLHNITDVKTRNFILSLYVNYSIQYEFHLWNNSPFLYEELKIINKNIDNKIPLNENILRKHHWYSDIAVFSRIPNNYIAGYTLPIKNEYNFYSEPEKIVFILQELELKILHLNEERKNLIQTKFEEITNEMQNQLKLIKEEIKLILWQRKNIIKKLYEFTLPGKLEIGFNTMEEYDYKTFTGDDEEDENKFKKVKYLIENNRVIVNPHQNISFVIYCLKSNKNKFV